jgi:hypothetical protein
MVIFIVCKRCAHPIFRVSEKLKLRRKHYKEDRPYNAIGYNVPIALIYPDGITSPSS